MFITSENFVKYILEVGSLGPCRLRSGGKSQKKGVKYICRKNNSERSKLSGGNDYRARLALLADFFFFFASIFSFSPNTEPGPRLIIEVGCVFKAPLHLVSARGMVFTQ